MYNVSVRTGKMTEVAELLYIGLLPQPRPIAEDAELDAAALHVTQVPSSAPSNDSEQLKCQAPDCSVCSIIEKLKKKSPSWCFDWIRELKDWNADLEYADREHQVHFLPNYSDEKIAQIRVKLGILQTKTVCLHDNLHILLKFYAPNRFLIACVDNS